MKNFDTNKWIKNGKIVNMPRKLSDKYNLYLFIAHNYLENKIYKENEINEILKKLYNDYCIIRREMVDFKILKRDFAGKEYKFNDEKDDH